MGKRWTWVAWSMLAIYVVGVGVGMPLMVANGEFQRDPSGQASLLLAFTAFMVMGAVIVAHRPGNASSSPGRSWTLCFPRSPRSPCSLD